MYIRDLLVSLGFTRLKHHPSFMAVRVWRCRFDNSPPAFNAEALNSKPSQYTRNWRYRKFMPCMVLPAFTNLQIDK